MCWSVIWRIIFFLLSVSSFLFILGRGGRSDRSSVRRKQKSHLDTTEASPAGNGLVQGRTAYVHLGTSFFPGQAVWLLLPCRLFVRVSQSYLWFSFFLFFELIRGNRVYWNIRSGLLKQHGRLLRDWMFYLTVYQSSDILVFWKLNAWQLVRYILKSGPS